MTFRILSSLHFGIKIVLGVGHIPGTSTKILMGPVIYATAVRDIKLASIGHILALRGSPGTRGILREKQFLPYRPSQGSGRYFMTDPSGTPAFSPVREI